MVIYEIGKLSRIKVYMCALPITHWLRYALRSSC